MILKNDFYSIGLLQQETGSINALLQLNPEHAVFAGHFPGQPVVPGVCMVQMVKEILETVTGHALQLKTADHIKFLSMVNPQESVELKATITYTLDADEIKVTAALYKSETVCLKMKGLFSIVK